MTAARFAECLALLRWSQRGLADALGCDPTLAKRWAKGVAPVPPAVAAWLGDLAALHAARPAPAAWRVRPTARAPVAAVAAE